MQSNPSEDLREIVKPASNPNPSMPVLHRITHAYRGNNSQGPPLTYSEAEAEAEKTRS